MASIVARLERFIRTFGVVIAALVVGGVAWALILDHPVRHAVAVFLYIGAGLIGVIAVGGTSTNLGRGYRGASAPSLAYENRHLGDGLRSFPVAVLLAIGGALVEFVF